MNRNKIKKVFSFLIKAINIILIWLSLILVFISIFKKDLIIDFIEYLKVVIEWIWNYNYLIALLSSFIEAFPVIGTLLPWQNILLIVWWFFWNISYYNLAIVICIASIWAILWNYVGYLLWQKYWDIFFSKYWSWFGIWLTEVKYLKKSIEKWWWIGIIFWKFHPLTRSFLPFIAWSMGMKNLKFMFFNTIWSIIRATTIIILWVVFVEYYKIIVEHVWKIMILLFILIWFYIYKYKREEFKKYMVEKNKELENMTKK